MRSGSKILKKENCDSCIFTPGTDKNRPLSPSLVAAVFFSTDRFLLCPKCARLILTHRPGLSFESSITQARNRCCLAREINSEVSDLSRMNAASVAYSFLMFYPSRA